MTKEGSPDASLPDGFERIHEFEGVWGHARPTARLEAARAAARRLRERMLQGPRVSYYRSMELVRAPYPVRYALRDASTQSVGFVHIVNRLFVIQFEAKGVLKTLLVSPVDHASAAQTPFFRRLSERFGRFAESASRLLAPVAGTVESRLAELGISPGEVDYITYDHLHTQDVRRWLGNGSDPGALPNARLLVMRQEWESTLGLLPPQADWYRPHGIEGVPLDRVVLLDDDVMLGDGLALVRTPGHTEGNHSVVAHTPEGLFVTSENGVGPDAYAPEHSRIPGVARHARETGVEVVLNGNTLDRGLDQYISMVIEKELAGPSVRDGRFPNVACSSEMDAYWLFPGMRPTFRFGDLEFGRLSHRQPG
jgi:glyoxylase-like metal-dependent hydrolase (beta-lactamase superfamily II)